MAGLRAAAQPDPVPCTTNGSGMISALTTGGRAVDVVYAADTAGRFWVRNGDQSMLQLQVGRRKKELWLSRGHQNSSRDLPAKKNLSIPDLDSISYVPVHSDSLEFLQVFWLYCSFNLLFLVG